MRHNPDHASRPGQVFEIRGADIVTGAGDVNGDGLADLAGALFLAPDQPSTAFAIFGSPDQNRVRPTHLGSRGFAYGVPGAS